MAVDLDLSFFVVVVETFYLSLLSLSLSLQFCHGCVLCRVRAKSERLKVLVYENAPTAGRCEWQREW